MTISIHSTDMTTFAAVVREGSFTRAARSLGVTKQGVSLRVARLEEQLGVRLLERTTRAVRPTEAGARYYERCVAIAAQIDEANDEARARQVEPVGTLRISAPVLYGRRFLAPVVTEFVCRHPRVRVELLLADRRVDLVGEGFDLAIRIGDLDDSSLTARRLGSGRVAVVGRAELLAGRADDALGDLRCVGMRAQETWTIGGRAVRVEPDLVVNDLEVVLGAVLAGAGVAQLPTLVCGEALRDGRLRTLTVGGPDTLKPVWVVYSGGRRVPARVARFVEALVARDDLLDDGEIPDRSALHPS